MSPRGWFLFMLGLGGAVGFALLLGEGKASGGTIGFEGLSVKGRRTE